jgi:hypothetical protein
MLIDLTNEDRLAVVTTGTGPEVPDFVTRHGGSHGGSQLDYHGGGDCRQGDYIVEDAHRPSTGD